MWWVRYSLVVVCKLFSTCVRFISISNRWAPLMCDVQLAPLELWWRAPLEVKGCVLSGWGVGGFMGDALSTFGTRGSSLILVGLLLSSCEGLHSTYFWELVSTFGSSSLFFTRRLFSRCDILGDTTLVVPGESASVLAGEPLSHFGQWLLSWIQSKAPVKLQLGTRGDT